MEEVVRQLEVGALTADALAATESIPVVRGREVLFVYQGPGDGVKGVRLVHHVAGLPRSPMFEPVGSNGLYVLHLTLPERARMEYTLRLQWQHGGEEIRTDLRNPRVAWCPFGPTSVVETEAYRTPEWSRPRDGTPGGTLKDAALDSRFLGGHRTFTVYVPAAVPPPRGYPLLLVLDGGDYRQFAGLVACLDNLIASGAMAPVVAVLSSPRNRNYEYSCTPGHTRFVGEELLPWVLDRYPVSHSREHAGILGASFGAVSAIHIAHRYPRLVGRLFLQSGSFLFHPMFGFRAYFTPRSEFDRIRLFLEAEFFPDGPAGRMTIFQTCGTFEDLLPYNREFARLLEHAGHDVRYRESHDGHNWVSWRDHFGEGLAHLFAP